MIREIDCRGLACPLPVLRTKKVLDQIETGTICAIVDNPAAKENVIRLAAFMGCEISLKEKESNWYLTITKTKGVQA
ncbi:MAG: sulfurtransferase TusA family protein [Candidatus Omnitrophica bacterium]|nr:sulfurtransferase TusA family protein [Candidatus Omnitrophota bacterium]